MASRKLPVVQVPTVPDDVIRQAIKERNMPPALFDQIVYNGGKPAAIVALLNWQQRTHNHVPGEACSCS
jgi:hypothetical protein